MKRLLDFLRPILILNLRYPLVAIAVAVSLSFVAGWFATGLRVDTDLANLLPKDHPTVIALQELQQTLGGETTLQVAIRSPEFDANVAFADSLIAKALLSMDTRLNRPFFERAEFRRETQILRENALWLATESELNEITAYLVEEITQAKEDANPFLFDLFEDEDFADEDVSEGDLYAGDTTGEDTTGAEFSGVKETRKDLSRFRETYNRIIPSEYPVNEDSTLLVIQLYPTGSKSDIRYLEMMFEDMGSVIKSLDPTSFHPQMDVRYGGRLKRHLDELNSVMGDVFKSFASGLTSVILLVMLYFYIKSSRTQFKSNGRKGYWRIAFIQFYRSPVSVAVIGVPLMMSLLMTFGITWLVIDSLNTMTAVLFVILFGLGIDYGIHFYARYLELRGEGTDVKDALITTYETTGSAIFASALTTASALLILMVAEFRGFSEFGFISGLGILLALLCMLWILPALIVVFERFGLILVHNQQTDADGEFSNPLLQEGFTQAQQVQSLSRSTFSFPAFRQILIGGFLLTGTVLLFSDHLRFEYEFGKLEPEFPDYLEFRKFASGVDEDTRRNPAYILADTHEEIFEIVDSLQTRKLSHSNTTIGDIESLTERFPYNEQTQQEKLLSIARIRNLLQDPFLRDQKNEDLDLLREASQTRNPLTEADLPEFLKNRFVTKDGTLGKFVIVYPSVGLSDGRNSIAFKHEIGEIGLSTGRTVYAASTSLVAAEMLDLMRRESPYMVGGTFLMVFIFMLFTFRSFRWSFIAAIPLAIGLVMLFGLMLLLDFKFNFYNLVVLPAILGIGCDNGIHIAARYREEGRQSLRTVLRSTGQHISIGSLTTMMGFGGLLFTTHPGLRSLGEMAVLGIGMALITALTFMPALLQYLENKGWTKLENEPGQH